MIKTLRNEEEQQHNRTMKRGIITGCMIGVTFLSSAGKMSKEDYVEQWKSIAISEMLENGIPASITLAQGILESGSGNSVLATQGNNHFGIKCHGWTGEKIYLDDDKEGECFRVYPSADESFSDHSEFLKKYDRYSELFTYEITDYTSWANGLKKAGYATNPKYATLLIELIEELGLDQYDTYSEIGITTEAIASSTSSENKQTKELINAMQHNVWVHSNKVRYIIARPGDTYYRISKEFGLSLRQLYRYNSYDDKKDVLQEGDIVYIMPKRKANLFKKEKIELETDMTVREISQKYAVSEKALRRLNHFTDDFLVNKGEIVTLR